MRWPREKNYLDLHYFLIGDGVSFCKINCFISGRIYFFNIILFYMSIVMFEKKITCLSTKSNVDGLNVKHCDIQYTKCHFWKVDLLENKEI